MSSAAPKPEPQAHAPSARKEPLPEPNFTTETESRAEPTDAPDRVRTDHALRTALTAILGFSEVIGQEMFGPVGNPQYRQYAKDIFQTGQDLMAVLEDVHHLSEDSKGPRPPLVPVCHLPTALNEAMRLSSRRARDAGVTLAVESPEDLPHLKADQRAVQQIILTLLLNAIRASDPGDLVSAVPDVTPIGEFRLTVQSQLGSLPGGEPLPVTEADNLPANDPGLADLPARLGLDIPRSLVELHGGRMEVHCIPEFGLRVTARFPKAWIFEDPAN